MLIENKVGNIISKKADVSAKIHKPCTDIWELFTNLMITKCKSNNLQKDRICNFDKSDKNRLNEDLKLKCLWELKKQGVK